ncbi:TPA: hypothetical protein NV714_004739 [Escherichia coli]|nr:hypothetical protein [Escherichia coli]
MRFEKRTLNYNLRQNKEFGELLKEGSLKLIASGLMTTVYEDKKKRVAIHGYKTDNKLYAILENRKIFTVYEEWLSDYNRNHSYEKLLGQDAHRLKNETNLDEFELFLHKIFSSNQVKNEYSEIITLEKREELEERIKLIPAMSQDIKNLILDNFKVGSMTSGTVSYSESCSALKDYLKTLHDNEMIESVYPDNFYIENNNKTITEYAYLLPELSSSYKFLLETAIKKNFDKNNRFDFNDGDYFFWVEDEHLFIKDQQCVLEFVGDKDNFVVYFFDHENSDFKKDKEILSEKITNNTVSVIDDIIFKVENGKLSYIDNSMLNSFYINVQSAVKVVESMNIAKKERPFAKNELSYIFDYHYTKYNMSKFEVLANMFLKEMSYFEYDKVSGDFYSDDMIYLPEIRKEGTTINKEIIFRGVFMEDVLNPKISWLNQELENELKEFLNFIKNPENKPKVMGNGGQYSDINKEKIIENMETLLYLNKLPNNRKLKR